MKKIFFIVDSYGYQNIYKTYKGECSYVSYQNIKITESFLANVRKQIIQYQPDLIFITNPQDNSCWKLGFSIPMAFLWYNTHYDTISNLNASTGKYARLNIVLDDWDFKEDKFFYHWFPINSELLYSKEKNIDIDFSMSINNYKDRIRMLDILKNNKIYYHSKNCSYEDYCEILNRSKIALNTCFSDNGKNRVKKRTFEAIASGCLLMETDNYLTKKYFTPMEDYINFINFNDMIDKIKHYQQNQEEVKKIAENGNKKLLEKFNSDKWWKKVEFIMQQCL